MRLKSPLFMMMSILLVLVGCNQKTKLKSEKPGVADQKWCKAPVEFKGFTKTESYEVVHRKDPMYPRRAAQKGVEACVFVAFDITTQGKPQNVRILKAIPEKQGFEESTAVAILGWRFKKVAKKDALVRLDFKLQ